MRLEVILTQAQAQACCVTACSVSHGCNNGGAFTLASIAAALLPCSEHGVIGYL